MQLENFRAKLREYLRRGGYSQKQLAHKLGLHPTQLSNKLNGHNYAQLDYGEVKQLVKILAEWGGLTSQPQALELLALMGLNYQSFSPIEWHQLPLALLDLTGKTELTRQPVELGRISQSQTDFSYPVSTQSALSQSLPIQQTTQPPESSAPPENQHLPNLALRLPPRRENWQGPLQTGPIYNRKKELEQLEHWIFGENCRVIGILGMGGMGKTTLTIKLIQSLRARFDFVWWYSLYNAPPLTQLISEMLQFLGDQTPPDALVGIAAKLGRLLLHLQNWRGLLVLDNWESLLEGGKQTGYYRPGLEEYRGLLEQLGQTNHQCCLLLTSREKPLELGLLENKVNTVRSLNLKGLEVENAQQILQDLGLVASAESQHTLVKHYSGNPLALKLVAEPVQTLFGGRVDTFLQEEWSVFSDIEELLENQLKRLSKVEQQLIYWLALAREPVSLQELNRDLVLVGSHKELAETLISLGRRNLLEIEQGSPRFSLQPVVLEYVTNHLVVQASEELSSGQLQLVQSHALLKAEAKEYVRASQERVIIRPIVKQLLNNWGTPARVVGQLEQVLIKVREQPFDLQGYSGGNLLNLLRLLKGNLNDYDFSGLRIWQANLQGISLERVNFEGADLGRSIFTQAFDSVTSVAFNPAGDLLAAGCYSGEVRVWEVQSGQQLLECRGHSGTIWSVVFSPDGKTLASGSADHTIKLWEVTSGKCLKTLQGHTNLIWSVAFSPDGRTLASGSIDQHLKLWEVTSGKCLKTLQGHNAVIYSVAYSPNGKLLASGSEDNSIKLWEVASGECLKTLQGHTNMVWSVAFNPDGTTLASGSLDYTIKLWEVASGGCLKTLQGHTNWVMPVTFSPDGHILASGGLDQNIKLWEVKSGECFKTLQGHTNIVYSVAFSPDGKTLISGSGDQNIKLWEVMSGDCLRTLQGYINLIWSVAFSPDSKTLVSGSADHTIKLWDVSSGTNFKVLQGHSLEIRSVAFSPDGVTLASGGLDQNIKLWDVNSDECLKTLQGHYGIIWSVAFSPDGKFLASGSEDSSIKIWEVASGKCLKTFEGHPNMVHSVAFSPDGKLLASGSDDHSIKLWDVNSGECLKTLQGHTGWVWSVAFSSNGRILASGGLDQNIKVWDVNSGECLKTLQDHTNVVHSVVFSPDGKFLASGSADQNIKVWDSASGECLKTLEGHTNQVWSVAFSPDGRILASGSADQSIKLWEVASDKCLSTLRAMRPYEGMNISGVIGITEAQKANLKALGAIRV